MKYNSIILIPPCDSHGDILSIISLVYYLLKFYKKVILYIELRPAVLEYFTYFFENEKLYNQRIFIVNDLSNIDNNTHLCNTYTGDWLKPSLKFYGHDKINTDFYFNQSLPLYDKLPIPIKDKIEQIIFPLASKEINHLVYYKLLGLNNNVRMKYFYYRRNLKKENDVKFNILNRYNIKDKYVIVNNPENAFSLPKFDYPTINISYLGKTCGELLSLIEDAESIHLVENNNANFIYHCQYKKIMKQKLVYFHIWSRNRCWKDIKLDYAWQMMDCPRLNNWTFLFDESDYKCK